LNIDHSSLEALDSISTILHNEQEPKTGVDKLQNINVNSVVNNNILKPPIESVKGTENQQINADEKNNIVEDRQQLQDSYINLLPEEIVKRKKMAFQDGMGIKEEFEKILDKSPKMYYNETYNKIFGV